MIKTTLSRIAAAAALASLLACPLVTSGQDSSGRPTSPQDPTGRPKIRKTGKPKKVISARPTTDVDKAPSSSVIIRSYPPGAEVYVDGVAVGTTADDGELELSEVRLGTHKIVLKKDGYREWSQVVTLRSTTDKEEIEPLLQSESATGLRDKSKIQPIQFGKPITGQITRDGFVLREGGGFYNEYMLQVTKPDAFVVSLATKGIPPKLRLVDDSNTPFAIEHAGIDIYHTAFIPAAGDYFLQVSGPIDESTFAGADYTIVVLPESEAHADRPIAIGDTAEGMLEPTDRLNGPGDYFDGWKFDGQAGLVVHILAKTNGGFQPSLTLLLDGKVVATSAQPSKSKKKKAGELPPDQAEITSTLVGGTYTLYVRSATGPKLGAYQLSITMGG